MVFGELAQRASQENCGPCLVGLTVSPFRYSPFAGLSRALRRVLDPLDVYCCAFDTVDFNLM